ncbi:hypothetical protein EDEG_02015 [Edhazardia aedis USNM 41457]|uniref:Uncharacterized protein n=1 Tax=Edhazardia aedis (strain USNM 41457) TaxID=1003232 RepID=J9D7B1_EDHAE|nr:hypothetical protein EDEG_02015 [Edhazardia aedis USNM 41457]|eukprot:EJW03666.1 hypothetical protein EDEG_02015 [Edhazardia aedis USNM 41457]
MLVVLSVSSILRTLKASNLLHENSGLQNASTSMVSRSDEKEKDKFFKQKRLKESRNIRRSIDYCTNSKQSGKESVCDDSESDDYAHIKRRKYDEDIFNKTIHEQSKVTNQIDIEKNENNLGQKTIKECENKCKYKAEIVKENAVRNSGKKEKDFEGDGIIDKDGKKKHENVIK